MAQAKIELKLGALQFNGEADAAWLEKQLDKVLEHVRTVDLAEGSENESHARTEGHKGKVPKRTTATIAAKLSCKVGVGKDVIKAAAARMTFVAGKESFTRAELLKEAKTATSYYKATVAKNLSNTLSGLLKSGDFTEVSGGTYSLSATAREDLEKRLAS